MLAAGSVYFSLPERFCRWAWLGVARRDCGFDGSRRGAQPSRRLPHHQALVVIASGAITVGMITSLVWLIKDIPGIHRDPPMALLRCLYRPCRLPISSSSRSGAGNSTPQRFLLRERDIRTRRLKSSFLFPQMLNEEGRDPNWSPQFMDYLFLAFNTSTAFSPTDTAVLSRWAKAGTMLQAMFDFARDRGAARRASPS